MAKLCFIDTETTGLDPDRHEIWEVGMIVREEINPHGAAGNEREYVWQLPVDLSRADPMALNIGRFHERYDFALRPPTGAPTAIDMTTEAKFTMPEWCREFVELTRDAHLVGAVVSFDADRLWRLLRYWGQCPMWHYHLIDVEVLAAGYLMGTAIHASAMPDERVKELGVMTAPPWDSDELSEAFSVDRPEDEKHTALGDARWARDMYDAVMGKP